MPNVKSIFLDKLIHNRFRPKEIERLFGEAEKFRRARPEYVSGVHKGTYFRVRVPPRRKVLPNLHKLPSPATTTPKPFRRVEAAAVEREGLERLTAEERAAYFYARLREWWKKNWPVLVLNFGSVCTLLGFTRSDVIELRTLSIAGSLCGIGYTATLSPFRWTPIGWGLTFVGVNAWNIYKIYVERNSTVRLTQEQEEMYTKYFMPHGVTPKHFESIYNAAEIVHYRKGDVIVRQGQHLEHVYLVVKGPTRASILNRRVSAASIPEDEEEVKRKGTAGAWIGEMAFLESCFIEDQMKVQPKKSSGKSAPQVRLSKKPNAQKAADESDPHLLHRRTVRLLEVEPQRKAEALLYTITARDDCTVLRWSHEQMQELIEYSMDMRSALIRAMTAAIVGKVVNFTVSRKNAAMAPSLSTWLGDWRSKTSATVTVDDSVEDCDQGVVEKLPVYPVDQDPASAPPKAAGAA